MPHTPGSWKAITRVKATDHSLYARVESVSGFLVAVCPDTIDQGNIAKPVSDKEALANARLIAAAPALLAACTAALEFARVYGPGQCATLEQIKAAIAAAEAKG